MELTSDSKKLLELMYQHHDLLYSISGVKKDQYVHLTISVEQLNVLSQAMASLACLIALNPSFKSGNKN